MNIKFRVDCNLAADEIIISARAKDKRIERIFTQFKSQEELLPCFLEEKKFMLPQSSFIRIITANKKVFGETRDKEYTLNKRLYELEENLSDDFIRISHTEIINRHYIKQLEITKSGIILIELKNGGQTSSSRRYLKKIKERLQ